MYFIKICIFPSRTNNCALHCIAKIEDAIFLRHSLFFSRTFDDKMSRATIARAFRFFSRGNEMARFKRTRNQAPVTSSFKLTYRRWLLCIHARARARDRVCAYVADPRVTGREEVVNNFQSCVFPSYISARCVQYDARVTAVPHT